MRASVCLEAIAAAAAAQSLGPPAAAAACSPAARITAPGLRSDPSGGGERRKGVGKVGVLAGNETAVVTP